MNQSIISKANIDINVYNACRTNTMMALDTPDKKFDTKVLMKISSGYLGNLDDLAREIEWYAKQNDNEGIVRFISRIGSAILSTYQIESEHKEWIR